MKSRPLFWSFVQQIGRQLTSYAIFLVLAALLSPKDFGILGVATAWIAFMAVFSELGFSVALIQNPNVGRSHFSSTFFLNVLTGILLTAAGVALARPAAAFLRMEESGPVIAALSFSFLINSFSITQNAMAQKELRFLDLAKRDILASLAGGALGIAMAWRGFGIWSLVAQNLAGNLVGTLLLWMYSPFRPRLAEVSIARLRELWSYSWSMFVYNFFKFLVQNADRLLIGFFLGAEAVGLYTFANKIILVPAAAVRAAIGAYLFPMLSAIQSETARIARIFANINRALSLAPIPTLLLAGAAVPLILPAAFGEKWEGAMLLAQLFTLVGAMQFLLAPVGELMKATGKPAWLLGWAVAFSTVTILCIALGAQRGVNAAGLGLVLAHAVVLPLNFRLAARMVPTAASAYLRDIAPFLLLSGFLALQILLFHSHITFPGKGAIPAAGTALLALALGMLLRRNRAFLAELAAQKPGRPATVTTATAE